MAYLVTMFEYCLVSGLDCWDLSLCAKTQHLDQLCLKLDENFDLQPPNFQNFYLSRFLAMKVSLYRLSVDRDSFRGTDCFLRLIFGSAIGAFRSIMRSTTQVSDINVATYEKIESKYKTIHNVIKVIKICYIGNNNK